MATIQDLIQQIVVASAAKVNIPADIKDQDGDGDVDINDILLSLKGGSGAGILGAATSILGGLFGKNK